MRTGLVVSPVSYPHHSIAAHLDKTIESEIEMKTMPRFPIASLTLTLSMSAFVIALAFPFLHLSTSKANTRNHQRVFGTNLQATTTNVVVIGGGWAGFSAADALSTIVGDDGNNNIQVELLDASPRGRGGLAGGWRTPKLKRPVEAGLHGFWPQSYRNTLATIERIEGIETIDDVLTPCTPSILVSESGRVATAPVLGSDDDDYDSMSSVTNMDVTDLSKVLKNLTALVPPPLDIALLTEYSPTSPLTFADRMSGLGLLGAWADFGQEDQESWTRYDKISAETLFLSKAGITPTLYREMVTPLLHVLPMTPGYDCSAAAALSCFHVFALQSKGAFDVRWCRGTISERIFNPWATQLQARGNVHIRGSSKVTSVTTLSNSTSGYKVVVNDDTTLECDAVVFAIGGTSMKRLLSSCPPLQAFPVSQKFAQLRGVTCVAVRIFLEPDNVTSAGLNGGMYDSSQLPPRVAQAMVDSPVIVCGPRVGGIPELSETGFCIYDLQRLHDEFAVINQNQEDNACAALEVDFFRADTIANIDSDEEVAKLALRAVAAALDVEELDSSTILDVSVVRARDAVSHFCVDSSSASPDIRMGKGIYFCGDWVDRTGHASWSTEKAVVTGRQAAASLAKDFGLHADNIDIIPAAPDTAQLGALREASKAVRGVLSPFGKDMIPLSPWVLARQIVGGSL